MAAVEIYHVNDIFRSYNYGFTHTSIYDLFDENGKYHQFEGKASYCNRTWERYEYQTSRRICLYNMRDWRVSALKEKFLAERNRQRMSPKIKAEFEKSVLDDAVIKAIETQIDFVGRD